MAHRALAQSAFLKPFGRDGPDQMSAKMFFQMGAHGLDILPAGRAPRVGRRAPDDWAEDPGGRRWWLHLRRLGRAWLYDLRRPLHVLFSRGIDISTLPWRPAPLLIQASSLPLWLLRRRGRGRVASDLVQLRRLRLGPRRGRWP